MSEVLLVGRNIIMMKDTNNGRSFTSLHSDDEAERYAHRRLWSIIESRVVILGHYGAVAFLSLGNAELRFAGRHLFLAFGSHSPRPKDSVSHFTAFHPAMTKAFQLGRPSTMPQQGHQTIVQIERRVHDRHT